MDTIQIEGWRMSILHDGEVRSEFTAFSQVLQAEGRPIRLRSQETLSWTSCGPA